MIAPKVSIHGDFHKTEMLLQAYKKTDGSYFTLGVHEDAGAYPAPPGMGGASKRPLVGEVAWWLEKGTEHMPARPFLNPALDENLDTIKAKMAQGLVAIGLNRWTVEKGLVNIAQHCLTLVQNKIKSNTGVALSGSWEPPRGYLGWKRLHGMAQRTLIATGLLFRSVGYKIFLSDGARAESEQAAGTPPGANDAHGESAALRRAAAREQAKTDKRGASGQSAPKTAQAGRDALGRLKKEAAPEGKASVGKAHQAAKARRGRYRKK